MKTFKEYLAEAAESDGKLKHLTHLEDFHIDNGKSGFDHAIKSLHVVKNHVESGKSDSSLTEKWDGCVHEDTLVVTKSGNKKILDLSEDDYVKCFDISSNEYSFYKNSNPIKTVGIKPFVKVLFDNDGELILTGDHPILIITDSKEEYIPAINCVGLFTKNLKIIDVLSLSEKFDQWDLSTPTDNFVISVNDVEVIVHNSPSVVMGHHPETGKFFVASKSAFNKDPKINYTPEDIEKNHGHAPGLVEKLKAALEHGQKILPKSGVFQGDILHAGAHDMTHSKGKVSIKPNTITYTAKGDVAEKLKKSKFGVALHTEYHGSTLDDMKAAPITDHSKFKSHEDVFAPSVSYKSTGKKLSKTASYKFNSHISAATESHSKTNYDHIIPHAEHLNTYINQTVRTGETPNHEGFVKHLETKRDKAIDSVKTEKSKTAKAEIHNARINSANTDHKESIIAALNTHRHIQSAKDILVKHMDDSHAGMESSINGKKVGPEGYVHNADGKSSKFVNRAEFSRANFQR